MSIKKESVLITGGLGQVGYYIHNILKESFNIYIIDNQSNSKFDPPSDAIFIRGNIQDKEIYANLPIVDYIVHCAAQISINDSVENPVIDAQTNIIGTIRLLEYAKQVDIKKFVFLSSAATFGNPQFIPITEDHPKEPLSPYGLSKLTSENYVLLLSKLYNLDCVVVVPFNIYSPHQDENDPYAGVIFKFIKSAKDGKSLIIEGDGKQTRDFIHAKDVASAVNLILKKDTLGERVFNIGSGESITILDLALKIIKLSGKDLSLEYSKERVGDIKDSVSSIEKAKKVLGFVPQISLEQGLEEIFNFE